MTPQEQLARANEDLDVAIGRLRQAEADAMLAARTRKKNESTDPTEVSKIVHKDEVAQEVLAAARRAHEAAKVNIIIAEKRIEASERNERHRLQHERGVLPIRSLQTQANALEAQLAQVRAQQTQIFLTEVAPRNPEWVPTTPFSQPPPHCYLNVGHVIQAGQPQPKEKEPLPPSTLQPRSGAPLDESERLMLLFALDRRGDSFCADAHLTRSLTLKDLYALGGDPRWGGEAVHDPELMANIRANLTRATNIARAVRGDEPSAEWCTRRLQEVRGWIRPTGPIGADGKPALDHAGNIRPEA